MPDIPAPGGDTQHVERGPELLSPLPGERQEPLAGPRPPEAERPRETGAPPRKPSTPAEAEARSAGGQAARALVGTESPAEIPEPPSSEPPTPKRRVQPFVLRALQLTAGRQAGFEKKAA